MAVINTIKEFIDSRGMTPYQFWKATGLAQATAYRLYKNPADIPSGSVMEAIFKAFPDTEPNDLIRFVPNEELVKK